MALSAGLLLLFSDEVGIVALIDQDLIACCCRLALAMQQFCLVAFVALLLIKAGFLLAYPQQPLRNMVPHQVEQMRGTFCGIILVLVSC